MHTPATTQPKKPRDMRNLIQRTPGANFEVRTSRLVDGKRKQQWISTGTNIHAAALAERTRLMRAAKEARRTGRWERFGLLKLRTNLPTLDELQAAYGERIARETVRAPGPNAQRDYWRYLRAVVAWGKEMEKHPKDAGGLSVAVLAGAAGEEIVKTFRERWLAQVTPGDLDDEASRRRSGDSMLRQARACFGRDAMKCYAEWAMPELRPFLETAGFGGTAPQHLDIDPGALKEMAQAADKLLDKNPRLYIVHLAHKFLAMRNSEIHEARVGWFSAVKWEPERPAQWMMEVSERCGFKPKASEGSVPLKRELAAQLAKAWKKLDIDPSGDQLQYIIPARDKTERYDVIYHEHRQFVRRFLPREDFSKAGYELRRWAFRHIQAKHASREAAKAFIRHKMPADAGRHYQARFYPWGTLGDDVGISLLDARGGASSMSNVTAESDAWKTL